VGHICFRACGVFFLLLLLCLYYVYIMFVFQGKIVYRFTRINIELYSGPLISDSDSDKFKIKIVKIMI